ncbi:Multidrug resistance protein MdtC [Halomicronema hongdechloris C2206]|uniref:Multidrug resistance protein MdtC n=1 Tax=Halomicronema hongdechloris C2206 TaxID=1641165 RepID=A0A1Z3HSC3_9CYAN|nr:efflux RND transporter permease subunit [Halomicronema hongdechloris]ASC73199.1 Multidrug resistance protein MdtC [Halomicronema hongdechloris C2206]
MQKGLFSPALRHHLNISRLAIRFPWLTIGFWIAVTVAGLFAFGSLKYALFPDITFPVVVVTANGPFETALVTEAELTTPLEGQLQSLEDLQEIRSVSYPGRAVVNLSFKVGRQLTAASEAVEAELDALDLPTGASYQMTPLNLNESAVVSYAITDDGRSLQELATVAEADIAPAIATIAGVSRVDILGQAQPPTPDTDAAIAQLPTLIQFNGDQALALRIIKQAQANTLEVVRQVEQQVEQLRTQYPQLQLTQAATQADYIQEAVQATIDSLILAILIAVGVIFLFLRNWRATLITALAIPISLLGTAIVMASYQFNLETITLLALALVIGIIVDDAIVEVENIVRHIDEGNSPRRAALLATQEIGLTVSAATLTIVAVFLPVALMEGTVGQFFKPFGLTVSAAVLISLLIARTLSPVLSVYWLRPHRDSSHPDDAPEASRIDGLSLGYRHLLAWSLQHRWIIVGLALLSLGAGVTLIPLIPQGFIPQLDRGEFNVVVTTALPSQDTPTGANRGDFPTASDRLTAATDGRAFLLEATQRTITDLAAAALATTEVDTVFTTIGDRGTPNRALLYVRLRDDREATTAEVQAVMRATLPVPEGSQVSVEAIPFVDTGGEKPLQIALLGSDIEALQVTTQAIKADIVELSGFVDVNATGDDTTDGEIGQIDHLDGQRVAYINANLAPDLALGDATQKVVSLATPQLPAGVDLDLGSDSARAGSVLRSFLQILALAILCMLLVLMLPFGRLLEPLVVVLSLPLSLVGATLALLITGSEFGMISLIGLLFLLGLLDKNALLLLDYINQLRRDGLARTEAILKTGMVRLRPILMTTASTILGMLPIAIGWGAGAELRQPMAVAIIGGLFTSALLSLIVVPVLYTLLEDSWRWLRWRA